MAERRHREIVLRFDLEQRDVALVVMADNFRDIVAPVLRGYRDFARILDDMLVGHDKAGAERLGMLRAAEFLEWAARVRRTFVALRRLDSFRDLRRFDTFGGLVGRDVN